MNLILAVVLVMLVAVTLIELISEVLNLRSLADELPDEFVGVYDAEDYARSQDYTRAQTKFGMFSSIVSLAVLLGFWMLGGFEWLDVTVRGLGFSALATGLLYLGALGLASEIFSLPFKLWSTFVIEERFGFNQSDLSTFVIDQLKMLALGVALGAPLIAALLGFFLWAGPMAWVYAWIAVTAFSLALSFIAPTWIMPLFNEFTPLDEGELRSAIFGYAESVRFPLTNIFVMDGSKRSSKSNAFLAGFGSNKRIALFDTLVEQHSVGELVAVLAHEIGHFKKKHIVKGVTISVIHFGVLFYLLSLVIESRGLFDAFFVSQLSVHAGLVFFAILYTPVSFLLSIAMNWMSRRHEYEADRYSVETTHAGDAMIQALKTLSLTNLSNLTPHPFCVFLSYSHPPVLERIQAIRAIPATESAVS
jgi:STE24 endopeptidase